MAPTTKVKAHKILIVEDEASYRALLQSILRKVGHNCIACINGDQAVEKLKKEQFDLIIIDYLLPGPNALDVIRWARQQNIKTPFFVITAYPSEHLSHHCEALGNVTLLIKLDFELSKLPAFIAEKMG